MERRITNRMKWEITLCPMGKIHVHYQTGSSDYLLLAQELREVADQMAALSAQSGIGRQPPQLREGLTDSGILVDLRNAVPTPVTEA